MYAVPWSKDLKSNVHKQYMYYTEKFIYKYFLKHVHTLCGADYMVATIHCVVAMVTIWRRIWLRFWRAIREGAGTAKNISVSQSQTPVLFFLILLALEIKGGFFYFYFFTIYIHLLPDKREYPQYKYTIRLRLWPKLAFVLHCAQYFAGSTMNSGKQLFNCFFQIFYCRFGGFCSLINTF